MKLGKSELTCESNQSKEADGPAPSVTMRRALWRSRGRAPGCGKQLGRGRGCGGQGAESPGDTRLPGSLPLGGPSGSGAGRGVADTCVRGRNHAPGSVPRLPAGGQDPAPSEGASFCRSLPPRGGEAGSPTPADSAPSDGGRPHPGEGAGRTRRLPGLSGSDWTPGVPVLGDPSHGRVLCPGLQEVPGVQE